WMTKMVEGEKGEGKIFPTPNSAITAYDFGEVGFRAKIKVLPTNSLKYKPYSGEVFETTVGRLLFNSVLPTDFSYINNEVINKKLSKIVDDLINQYGLEAVPKILDKIKDFGYKYVMKSGITWGIDDVKIPKRKTKIIEEARKATDVIVEQFSEGLLSEDERYRKTIEIWQATRSKIEGLMPETLSDNSPIKDMLTSGARGSINAIVQMGGMKGLIINTAGRTIDFPIVPSNIEGLSPLEYFITTHGSRKGLVDTALNTARAGYLTRRLVDVAQNAIITEEDCGDKQGRLVKPMKSETGLEILLSKRVRGRIVSKNVVDSKGNVLFKKGHLISKRESVQIDELGIEEMWVRTPLTCRSRHGICQQCYGTDLGRNELVKIGGAVGIVAAQAIGEPGTQLTMRTFHQGGIAAVGGDITMGLPRVEEIFERRIPKSPAIISKADGEIMEVEVTDKDKKIVMLPDVAVSKSKKEKTIEYSASIKRMPLVKAGDKVKKGQLLTDGSANIAEIFKYAGKEAAQEYVISEALKIYELQGASISPKHVEVIIRQMFSRVRIKDAGDTNFTVNNVVEKRIFDEANEQVEAENGIVATGESLVLGISEVSLTTKSWLSAASFQHTTRILIDAAVEGRVDELRGLKENVIIGRLIPAGTGIEKDDDESGEDDR
ncbi:MAG: DNA-directed RNA polymerase subunit beta', partial [Candidatus Pacebacteria bacterium]|nr:DNA-directed RNA polymerase subunit beta' [Candidatus Paceibacterota bacterium]